MRSKPQKGNIIHVLLILSSFFISCAPSRTAQQSQVVTAYATSSAQPWMSDLFACADELAIGVLVSAEEPDIYLRIGEPDTVFSPAFQIDEEELLIVTNRESLVQNLSLEEAQALFSGVGELSASVWVYPSGLDVQAVFDQFVMQGRAVNSSARVAVNPQQMSDVLNSEPEAVGILPRHWKAGDARDVYSAGMFPVIALTREEPQGAVASLISCLQK